MDVIGAARDGAANADSAFAVWVNPHVALMRALAARLTSWSEADDLVQDALVNAWRFRDRYDANKGSPRTWLLALTADQVRRRHRRLLRRPAIVSDRVDGPDGVAGATEPPADLDLRVALRQLTRKQQVAVAAYYYLDLPVDEVAVVMDCSAGTAKSTLSAARARLYSLLSEGDVDER
jgi:RNA polymerase sigma-70 factor (ECF subfamily)